MRALALLLLCWIPLAFAQRPAPVLLLTQTGAIGPASADYLHRGFARAAELRAQLVVIKLDTPGGLDVSMRAIIQDILASPVPVATYVAPSGARAASAGTYILYASHIAAMAPATNLGAATPVAIGGGPDAAPAPDKSAKGGEAPTSTAQTLARKQRQDAAAYIRGLAQLRGRNAEWAERAVREAASLSAEEAKKLKVIDLIADDVPRLLRQLDGRKLAVAGREVALVTAQAEQIEYSPDWRTRLLAVITEPSVAYILLLLGIYGLFFEFYNPGMVAPGVVGAISLLLALFAFQLLPVSYAGLALLLLGIGLLIAEHFVAGFGVLGFGGIVAFVIGSVMLIEPDAMGYRIPWPLIAVTTLASATLILVALGLVVRARRRPVVSGREELTGATGEVVEAGAGGSFARIHGELWKVRAGVQLARGDRVRVVAVEGLVLAVEPLPKGEAT
jgi:membrane-bound serine protease (ClpP class)